MSAPVGPTDAELELEARALLGAVREPPAVSNAFRAQARSRLLAALPLVTPVGAPPSAPLAPSRGLIARVLASKVPGWSILASFVVGGAVGAVAMQRVSTREVPVPVAVVSVAAAPAASIPAPVVAAAPPTSIVASSAPSAVAVSTVVSAPPSARSAPPALSADETLEAERALLDVARTAVGRGDGASALRAAQEHARKFPRGVLAEEREAMTVQALRLLHRDDEANARLDRFRGRYPTSLLRPALEATDGGAP